MLSFWMAASEGGHDVEMKPAQFSPSGFSGSIVIWQIDFSACHDCASSAGVAG
jgi:hypothetical protein